MDSQELNRITAAIKEANPEIGLQKIEFDGNKASLFLSPTKQALAGLESKDAIKMRTSERASTINRSPIGRSNLDLMQTYKSPYDATPKELFQRSLRYYVEQDLYGSIIDTLTNLASKGFENDLDDPKIKLFYDVWNLDVNFKQIINWIFFDFFRVGMVRTYKIVGKYEPGITYLSSVPGQSVERSILRNISARANKINEIRKNSHSYKEYSAKKKKWSSGYIPIAYTVLNPLNIEITGSLLFNDSKVTLTPSDEIKKMLQKNQGDLSEDEKEIVKLLTTEFKNAVKNGGAIPLDPMYVGSIDYRKMPYERYPRPRGVKSFEAIEYKTSLRQADLSTLDGITNYILKVTIGNDEFPANQTQLETVAKLFDNTSKSFDVVWNHTLEIEKIVSPEIESILGQEKYNQVNEDITSALAMSRALIDGNGDLNSTSASLLAGSLTEEISYARYQVEMWIYNEYRDIAESQGFDRFPKVRWDNTILKNIILYMSAVQTLVDRRMLSYRTALEQLGFEYDNEFANMQEELPSVKEGILGIVGSPFQRSGIQPTGAPVGTPSDGRPKGKPAKNKQPNTNIQDKTKIPNQAPSQQPKAETKTAGLILREAAKELTPEQFDAFAEGFITTWNSFSDDASD